MNKMIRIFLFLGFPGFLAAQQIGVNTNTPYTSLHVASPAAYTLTLENLNPLGAGNNTGILFSNNMDSPGGYNYTAAIQSIGESNASARLGFFTHAGNWTGGLTERLTIANNGNIGLGTTTPDYKLDVAGDINMTGNLGIHVPPSDFYSIDVTGTVRLQNDLRINGILNPNNPLVIGNSVAVESFITVDGKGIVRSTNSTQMKMKRLTASFSASNFAAGATITSGLLHFNEDFDAVSIVVGNLVTGTGDWAKIMLVPFNVDLADDSCQFALTNVGSSTITFTGTWTFVAVGN